MKAAIYKISTGEILRFVICPPDHVSVQCREGEEFFLNCPKDATHIINNTPATIEPVIPIETIKSERLTRLKNARDAEESGGFTFMGKDFDSDPLSIQRITVTAMAAQGSELSIDWTCKDGTTATLNSAQLKGMLVTMVQRGDTIHKKWRQRKQAVLSASTKEEVEAITW